MKNALALLMLLPFMTLGQTVIPSTATFHVKESNVFWNAQVIDTLELTVIDAGNIAIRNTSFPREKNIDKEASFKLTNESGEGRTVNGRIAGVVSFKEKELYTTELEIGYNLGDRWEYRTVQCILADLSSEEHRLIIGRNWLGENFKVE